MSIYFSIVGAMAVAVATVPVVHWMYQVIGFAAVIGFYIIGLRIQAYRRERREHAAWQQGVQIGRLTK